MAFNINEIRSQLTLGGARPSLFNVNITNPANSVADIKTPFLVRASQVPASTLGLIEVPYFGRKVKIAGDRTFAEWSVTIINDEDFLIRNAMEQWMQSINSHLGNVRGFGSASDLSYKSTAQVTQYSKVGVPVREYSFNGIFPINITEMEVDWNSTDSLQEFTVTFQYDWWEVTGGTTGNAGGN
jgi:hypothetical protein|tara:strand:+ start:17362 stop:17913 length:552 start_codon:yes stop_codon:yes gene_type:complete